MGGIQFHKIQIHLQILITNFKHSKELKLPIRFEVRPKIIPTVLVTYGPLMEATRFTEKLCSSCPDSGEGEEWSSEC